MLFRKNFCCISFFQYVTESKRFILLFFCTWKFFSRHPLLHKADITNRFSEIQISTDFIPYNIPFCLFVHPHTYTFLLLLCAAELGGWREGDSVNFLSSTILWSSLWHPEWDADQTESKKNTKKGRLNRRALGRKEVYRETERRYWILNRSRRNEIAFSKESTALPSFSFVSSPSSLQLVL